MSGPYEKSGHTCIQSSTDLHTLFDFDPTCLARAAKTTFTLTATKSTTPEAVNIPLKR